MRVVIGSKGIYLKIADWFCFKERITGKTAEIVKETSKAVLLDFGSRTCWVPKSVFTRSRIPAGLRAWQ